MKIERLKILRFSDSGFKDKGNGAAIHHDRAYQAKGEVDRAIADDATG
jgi:hypothetical protein